MVKIGGYLSYLTSLLAEFIRKAHRRHGPERATAETPLRICWAERRWAREDVDQHGGGLVFGAGGETTCPKCESEKVERQMSTPAKPQTEAASLPMGCDSSGPPCGPACRRFGGEG